ncbi:MAG: hypothetical protein JWQ35_662 [Bacteriovoracaceae bacterium]|nr:hypothetical protein [Bacteriovoracaceae bacterium]
MKVGIGSSKEKEPELALQEAYRKSLQRLGSTKSDLSLIFYSYDYGMDPTVLGGAFKKVFRDVPHLGSSTLSAWSGKEGFDTETGLLVMSLKDLNFEFDFLRVHSLKEKSELWSTELSRQLHDRALINNKSPDFLFVMADSLNFNASAGFSSLERAFPKTQICGVGASYSVPQVSIVCKGEVYLNALFALEITGTKPWMGLMQNILPELAAIEINRMSENLVIEIDQKPAFYKLCEHLMQKDDLPMMSPDQFRKHMGDLFVVETAKEKIERLRTIGSPHKVISLLGSEMTTGMVAVASELDFSKDHYLGQKKIEYAENGAREVLSQLKAKIEKPSMIWLFSATSRLRDRERKISDRHLVREVYPECPLLEVSSNGEYLGEHNQYAAIVIVFP